MKCSNSVSTFQHKVKNIDLSKLKEKQDFFCNLLDFMISSNLFIYFFLIFIFEFFDFFVDFHLFYLVFINFTRCHKENKGGKVRKKDAGCSYF